MPQALRGKSILCACMSWLRINVVLNKPHFALHLTELTTVKSAWKTITIYTAWIHSVECVYKHMQIETGLPFHQSKLAYCSCRIPPPKFKTSK